MNVYVVMHDRKAVFMSSDLSASIAKANELMQEHVNVYIDKYYVLPTTDLVADRIHLAKNNND